MKRLLEMCGFIFLFGIFILISYQKELSCYDCSNNQAPLANASTDTTITLPKDSAILNRSSSNDPDGTIASYSWAKIAGPVPGNILKPDSSITIVKGLIAGVYLFELTVTDNGGLSAKDTIQLRVDAPGNDPPAACAGVDLMITLPSNSVSLDG